MTDHHNAPGQARLYLVTPALTEAAEFLPHLRDVLAAAPVACVRLNIASADEDIIRRVADQVRATCHEFDVAAVLTDHYRLVAPLGLDGVHLANPRLTVRDARKALGDDAIVGAFAGTSRHDGMTMAEAGADYVSFGPVAGTTLGDGATAPVELFSWWAEMIETPVVAEGGLSLASAAAFAEFADFLCVGRAIWDAPDSPAAAASAFAEHLC